jgi:hypothetical protein
MVLSLLRYILKIKLVLPIVLFMTAFIINASDKSKVAKVIIARGKVSAVSIVNGKKKSVPLKKGEWLSEGVKVVTQGKSFVKLLFTDKSQVNLGPSGQMIISSFPKKEAGILTLVKGQVRSKVTKNYMDQDRTKSKLFIKTKTAAMGVRGTDFIVSYNTENRNTSLITLSGAVAMAKIDTREDFKSVSRSRLEKVISGKKAVLVQKGQFSAVRPKAKMPNLPVKVSPSQIEILKKNEVPLIKTDKGEKVDNKGPKGPVKKVVRSPIPPGVNSKLFSNRSIQTQIDKELKAVSQGPQFNEKIGAELKSRGPATEGNAPERRALTDFGTPVRDVPPEGVFNGTTGEYAPPAGGIIDLQTAQYIPPQPGSAFDAITQTYQVDPNLAKVDPETGNFRNDNYRIDTTGKFIPKERPDFRSPNQRGDSPSRSDRGDRNNQEFDQAKGQGPNGPEGLAGNPGAPGTFPPGEAGAAGTFPGANVAVGGSGPFPGQAFDGTRGPAAFGEPPTTAGYYSGGEGNTPGGAAGEFTITYAPITYNPDDAGANFNAEDFGIDPAKPAFDPNRPEFDDGRNFNSAGIDGGTFSQEEANELIQNQLEQSTEKHDQNVNEQQENTGTTTVRFNF